MHLLPEDKLIWSAVVANNRMNRSRGAKGINSYEKEFGFSPAQWLATRVASQGNAAWMDLCCGEARALLQVAGELSDLGIREAVSLHGLDLLPATTIQEHDIVLTVDSVVTWKPQRKFDLITCSHGLHYAGDKLSAIQVACSALSSNGLFIAHLDLDQIRIDGDKNSSWMRQQFRSRGFEYKGRSRVLIREGHLETDFDLVYEGADDTAGPNWTGQEAVASYYRMRWKEK